MRLSRLDEGGVLAYAILSFFTVILASCLISFFFLGYKEISVLFVALISCIVFVSLNGFDNIVSYLIQYNLIALSFAFPVGGFLVAVGVDSEVAQLINGSRPILISLLVSFLFVLIFFNSSFRFLFPLILSVLSITVSSIKSNADFSAVFAYLMNSFVCFYFVLIFSVYALRKKINVYIRYKWLIVICALVGVFSFFFNIVLHSFGYDLFRPDLYFSYRDRTEFGISYGEFPSSWSSSIGGFNFYRMTGSFSDPIQWGYFCSVMSLMCWYCFLVVKYKFPCFVGFLFFTLLLVLSGSKGSWLLFLGTIFIFYASRLSLFLSWSSKVFFVSTVFFLSSISGTSGIVHLAGLVGGVTSILSADLIDMLFGYGLGSGGNLLTTVGADVADYKEVWLLTGSESGFGVFVYQLGVFGVIVLFYVLALLKRELRQLEEVDMKKARYIGSFVFSYFILFLLQENLVNSAFLMIYFLFVIFMLNISGATYGPVFFKNR